MRPWTEEQWRALANPEVQTLAEYLRDSPPAPAVEAQAASQTVDESVRRLIRLGEKLDAAAGTGELETLEAVALEVTEAIDDLASWVDPEEAVPWPDPWEEPAEYLRRWVRGERRPRWRRVVVVAKQWVP